MSSEVFVFGSNLSGIMGKGAAKEAVKHHGAKWGVGIGYCGNSYAIPTKDEHLRTLPLDKIKAYIGLFRSFARTRNDLTFNVTRIGCGLAGYTDADIAPMFEGCPENVILPKAWGGSGFDW